MIEFVDTRLRGDDLLILAPRGFGHACHLSGANGTSDCGDASGRDFAVDERIDDCGFGASARSRDRCNIAAFDNLSRCDRFSGRPRRSPSSSDPFPTSLG